MTSTATLEGIRRIETVGAVVRGEYGHLCRIVEVIENSRCSERHISVPLDVVVRTEPVGPGYGHTSAWASTLTLAEPGDIGSHPHRADCPCGAPAPTNYFGWHDVRENWS